MENLAAYNYNLYLSGTIRRADTGQDWTFEQAEKELKDHLTQAMHKAALAVERQLSPWLQHDATCFLYTEEGNQEQCDCGLYTLRKQLTDKE